MKHFEKGKTQIVLFLIVYLAISTVIGLSSMEYLKPQSISYSVIIGGYSIFNIIAASLIYIYTHRRFSQAGKLENNLDYLSEEERKAKEEKEREEQEKQMALRRKEENKKATIEIAASIADPLADEIFPDNYFDQLLINTAKSLNIVQGVAYTINRMEGKYEIRATYAYYTTDTNRKFELGEGITGQVAKDQKILMLDSVPRDYIHVTSGLGNSEQGNLIVIPIVHDDETIAVLELAAFEKPSLELNEFYSQLNTKISAKIADLLK